MERKAMLTPRENFYRAAKGLDPDRFANQFEAIQLQMTPAALHSPRPLKGGDPVVNDWGVTMAFPDNAPGAFPVQTPDKLVIKDIEHWQDYVHAPSLKFPDEEWNIFKDMYDAVDTNLAYKAVFVAPGLFEQSHHLGEIQNVLVNLYEYEDEMHDLIKYLTDYELEFAQLVCSKLHPDAVFHHDDFGSRTSTFMKPEMWEDFYMDSYKEIYKYYHEHGCELVIHHSDSYGRTLVPDLEEMGVDVWQGCMMSNDIPSMCKEFHGHMGFMGGFDGADYDRPDWDAEDIRKRVFEWLDQNDPSGYIPCVAQGGPGSIYVGVYETIREAIDDYNELKFGIKKSEIVRAVEQVEMFR